MLGVTNLRTEALEAGATVPRMPALFVGHGSPMNAIEDTPFSRAWTETARRIPRPQAILSVSAHWETSGVRVTSMPDPPTLHDFRGFPEELNRVQYAAPGSPELARNLRDLLGRDQVALDQEWGLDHGTWSVLRRMYPAADIPVVQLSLSRGLTPADHYALGGRLQALREQGVLILGSGNLVHNLQEIVWTAGAFEWATRFDAKAKSLIEAGDHAALVDYPSLGPDAALAIPTNEHYLPALYVLALRRPGETLRFFAEGLTLGSISMRAFQIG